MSNISTSAFEHHHVLASATSHITTELKAKMDLETIQSPVQPSALNFIQLLLHQAQ